MLTETPRNPIGEPIGGNIKPLQRSILPQILQQFPNVLVPEQPQLIEVGKSTILSGNSPLKWFS